MSAARRRRGFTMIELMVAISTGLTVGLAAFLLAKVSLGAFQQDARVNNAQHAVLMAMNRVAADIRRGGFMTTPDASTDQAMCDRNNLAAARRALLVGVNLIEGTSVAAYGAAPNSALPLTITGPENNRAPDRVRISGNFMTTERITYRAVDATTNTVNVAVDTNAIQRIHRDAGGVANSVCRLFVTNTFLRLVDSNRRETYVRTTGCTQTMTGSLVAAVVINFATIDNPLPRIPGVCGVAEGNAGGSVNPVNIIEYSVQQIPQPLNAAQLAVHGLPIGMQPIARWDATVSADTFSTTGDDTRVDLLRRQLNYTGAVIANSGEVIADYAADFKTRARYIDGPLSRRLLDSGFDKDDGVPAGEPIAPNRIRSVGIRLTTRSKETDREGRVGATPAFDAPLDRFRAFPNAALRKYSFARVRTMYTEVSLPNLSGAQW